MIGLELDRDLVFFDIEATGLNIIRDRILQIALVKYSPGKQEPVEKMLLINPGVPISEEAFAVHGIGPEQLRNKPTFAEVGQELYDFIGDADLAGYNSNRFDVPMLMEEFSRVGLDFEISTRRLLDMQRIFYKMEPRTLRAALRFYSGKEIENAHDALADVRATVDVLNGQLDMYVGKDWIDADGHVLPSPIVRDVKGLSDATNDTSTADATRRLKYDKDGNLVFNFGVNAGKLVGKTLYHDRNYLNWILNKDFSTQVKQLIKIETKKYQAEYKKKKQANDSNKK